MGRRGTHRLFSSLSSIAQLDRVRPAGEIAVTALVETERGILQAPIAERPQDRVRLPAAATDALEADVHDLTV